MAKQNKDSELPTASSGSQQPLHQRTTSVPITLHSPHSVASNTDASSGARVAMDPSQSHGGVSKSVSHIPGEFIRSDFVNRGKDWESLHCAKPGPIQSSSSLFKTLKKTGFFDSDTGNQPKSSQGTGYPSLQLASPLPVSPKSMTPKSAPPLAPSAVQRYLHHSPDFPTPGLNASSPVSVGDQFTGTTPVRTIDPARPSSPDQSLLPKHVSAFEYAMRPFLDALADDSHERLLQLPRTHQVASSTKLLPLTDPMDKICDSEQEEIAKEDGLPEYGTSAHLWERDTFTISMQQTQLSVYLIHCTTLQGIIDQVQREPWKYSTNQSAAWYYGKMVELSYKARTLAEALKSDELQARCEYWAGRGCGGSRDYGAAEKHFHQAMLLDVPNDKYKNGRARPRGLLPKEKADVRFLLDSCHKRAKNHRHYGKRMMQEVERIRAMADEDGLPLDAYTDQTQTTVPSSPPWLPDRDRLVALAKLQFEKSSPKLEQALEEEAQVGLQTGDEYIQAENRRRLTKKEWVYIKYGDVQEVERRERQMSAGHTFQSLPKQSSALSRRSTGAAQSTAPLPSPQDLANELAGLGYDSITPEASPTSQYSTSSREMPGGALEKQPLPTYQTLLHELKDAELQRSPPPVSPTPSRSLSSSRPVPPTNLEQPPISSLQTLSHEPEDIERQRPLPPLTPTPSRTLCSSQALTPTALEQQLSSTSQTLPHEPIDAEWQHSLRPRTPPLEPHSSLSTESSISTDSESEAPFSIDFLLDKEDYDYRLQASSPPQLSLQQRRRGNFLDPITTIPVPPRSNRRPTITQAKNDSLRTPLPE
ncbi:hypothetical protein HBH50_195540 [Parastagonospora nodorum]|nr:hypothetical protein HBH50_195540 [Parastagonospora nodorum]KAH4082538.1 hypothetical protein HBH48_188010 [Parastagonospora nodorum]